VVVTAGLTALVLGVRPDMAGDPSRLVLAATAAVAVCAMILPGVSGSFLLLLLGTYTPVIAAVADRDIATIGVVALGAVVGLLASFGTPGFAPRPMVPRPSPHADASVG
jgi:putative membrane protein